MKYSNLWNHLTLNNFPLHSPNQICVKNIYMYIRNQKYAHLTLIFRLHNILLPAAHKLKWILYNENSVLNGIFSRKKIWFLNIYLNLHVPFRFLDNICLFPSALTLPAPANPRPSSLAGELCGWRRLTGIAPTGGGVFGRGLAPTGGLATGILGSGGRLCRPEKNSIIFFY